MAQIKLITRKVNVGLLTRKIVIQVRPAATINTGSGGGGGPGGPVDWDDVQNKPDVFPSDLGSVVGLDDALADMSDGLSNKQSISEKNDPDGYAGLNGDGKLSNDQIPIIYDESIGSVSWSKIYELPAGFPPDSHIHNINDIGDLATSLNDRQLLSGKDVPGGYVGLDGDGKINPSQLPAIAVTDRFVVGSEAAMLALTAETGDIAIRTDISETFMLNGDPTVLANWQQFLHPNSPVSSVFGRTGVVTAQNGDYNTGQVTESGNLYFTTARVLATALSGFAVAGAQAAITSTDTILSAFGKLAKDIASLASIAFSGSASDLTTGTLSPARITANALVNSKFAQVAQATFKGRATAGTGDVEDLTAAQATALLDLATTSLKGLAPIRSGNATEYLDGSGNYSTPAGSGGGSPILHWVI